MKYERCEQVKNRDAPDRVGDYLKDRVKINGTNDPTISHSNVIRNIQILK